MHSWYDDDDRIDWKGIGECADFIQDYLRKWGRISVHTKEKWGRVDVSLSTGWHQLFSITHPGYAYSRYPKWLWYLDCMYLSWIVSRIPIHAFHMWLIRRCYRLALARWPHLREEILAGAPNELGAEFGIHAVKTDHNCYSIHYDWHPDNWSVKYPREEEPKEKEPVIRRTKRDWSRE